MKAVFAPRPAARFRSIRSAAALYVGAPNTKPSPPSVHREHYNSRVDRSSTSRRLRAEVKALSSPPSTAAEDHLRRLGERVREERARRGMTRKTLARDSGLSERYLAQLEAGKGNVS